METWEMIKELTEHPKKKFKSTLIGISLIAYADNSEIITVKNYNNGQIRSTWNINRQWEEMKEPVNFMEAVESGKKISVEHKLIDDLLKEDERYCFTISQRLNDFLWNLDDTFSTEEIAELLLEGDFYIED